MKTIQRKKLLLWGILALLFLLIFIWDYKTPYMHDDFVYANNTFLQTITNSIYDYNNLNGRFFGQLFTRIILSNGRFCSSIIIASIFIIFIYYLGKLTNVISKDKVEFLKLILLVSSFFLFVPDFGSVVLWRAGAGNYLAVSTIMIVYLFYFIKSDNDRILMNISIMILAFIAGLGSQNASGGLILITTLLIILEFWEKKRLNLMRCTYLSCSIIGFIVLLFSPGDKKRMHMYDSEWLQMTVLQRIIHGAAKLVEFIYSNPLNYVFFSLIVVLIFYTYCTNKKNISLYKGMIFIISGIATGLVMCLSPEGIGVGRTYFGAFIFLICGAFYLLPDDLNRIFWIIVTALITFTCAYNLLYGVLESAKFNSQLIQRYNTIEKSPKNVTVDLQPIKYEKNKYSLSGSYVELGTDKDAFPNYVYKWEFNKYVILKN